ncbi:MAG: gliding motility protein GldM [Chitinophagales bacterium]
MSLPKEPRQQMINVMYIVLIAMLALSVSAEILNAFKIVNNGISSSNQAIRDQIDATLLGFQEKVQKEGKGENFYAAAQQAGEITKDFVTYTEEIEAILLKESGNSKSINELNRPDDQETPSRVMLGTNQQGKAYELKAKIEGIRTQYGDVLRKLGTESRSMTRNVEFLEKAMPLKIGDIPEDAGTEDWAVYNFNEMPMIAALTLLNQFRNDAISTESMIVQRLSELVGGVDIVDNNMKVVAIPSSKSVMQGDAFSLEVFLAAGNPAQLPIVTIEGKEVPLRPDGTALYELTANGLGSKTLNGTLTIEDANGVPKTMPFSTKFDVTPRLDVDVDKDDPSASQIASLQAQLTKALAEVEQLKNRPMPTTKEPTPTGVISADKMNVFYIGVDNPVSVSISGASISDVKTTIDNGQLSSTGRGQYAVRVKGPPGRKTNVNLAVGRNKITSKEFRIKKIPDPIPEIGGKSGGGMGTGEMKAQLGVVAKLYNFDFDARFDVLGFEMTRAPRGKDLMTTVNRGASFSGEAKQMLNEAKIGDIYYFDNIKVMGPDKISRTLPSISFRVR